MPEGSEDERELPAGGAVGEKSKNLKGKTDKSKKKKKRRKRKKLSAEESTERGVCYLSRIPPNMDPASLRHMLSQYGEIDRVFLSPIDGSSSRGRRKKSGGARGQVFSEGWVEFLRKGVAKRVASMLNGEQMGGRRRSSFFYDIWNIKYLSKFTWDELNEEIANKSAARKEKMALEFSAAKRERNFTLLKFDQARGLSAIEERIKKRKAAEVESSDNERDVKIYRQFSQNRPLGKDNRKNGALSKDILAGVFSNSLS